MGQANARLDICLTISTKYDEELAAILFYKNELSLTKFYDSLNSKLVEIFKSTNWEDVISKAGNPTLHYPGG